MYGTYQRLNVWVWATDRAVIYAAAKKLKPAVRHDRAIRRERHKFYRQMLEYHHGAQDTARQWRV